MILQHIIHSIGLLAALYLISLITFLSSTVKGSHVKTDGWSNTYNQHLYSDLTGTIRELAPTDDNDDTDTRFQPPLDADQQDMQALAEGYRLAGSEILAPSLSVSVNKEISRERPKRDVLLDNSSISASTLQPIISNNNAQTSAQLSNNNTDDGTILSDEDANSWARSLLLSAGYDGSGETTAETAFTHTETLTTIQLTTTEAITEVTIISTETPEISPSTETEVTPATATEIPTTAQISEELTTEAATITQTQETEIQMSTTEPISEQSTTGGTEIVTSGAESTIKTSSISTIQANTEESTLMTANSSPQEVTGTEIPSTLSTITTSETSNSISLSTQTVPGTISSEAPTLAAGSSTETSTSAYIGLSWFILYYTYQSNNGTGGRSFAIGSPPSSTIENQVANILNEINITCNNSCIYVSQNSIPPPDVELLVQLNVSLGNLARILLNNGLFTNDVTLNSSYRLTVRMIMNVQEQIVYNNTGILPLCKLCEFAFSGNCSANDNNTCVCYPDYEGQYCQYPAHSTLSYSTLLISTQNTTMRTTITTASLATSFTSEAFTLTVNTANTTSIPTTTTAGITATGTGETSPLVVTTENTSSTSTSASIGVTGTGTGETTTAIAPTGTGNSPTTTTTVRVTGTGTEETSTVIAPTGTGSLPTTTTIVPGTGTGTEKTSTFIAPTGTGSLPTTTTTVRITGTGTGETTTAIAPTGTGNSPTTTTTVGVTGTGTEETSTLIAPTGTGSLPTTTTTVRITGTDTGETTTAIAPTGTGSLPTTTTTTGVPGTGTAETTTVIAPTVTGSLPTTTTTIRVTGTGTGETTTVTAPTGTGSSPTTTTTMVVTGTGSSPTTTTTMAVIGTGSSPTTTTTMAVTGTGTGHTSTVTALTGTGSSATTTTTIGVTGTGTGVTSTVIVPTGTGSSPTTTTTMAVTGTGTGQTSTLIISTEYASSTTTISVPVIVTVESSTVLVPTGSISSSGTISVLGVTETVTGEATTLTVATELTSSITTTSLSTNTSPQITTNTTQMIATGTTTTITGISTNTMTTTMPLNCAWTSWVPFTNCSPSCGTAYQQLFRSCIDSISGGNCSISACGGGSTIQNESCTFSPPCQNVTIIPEPTSREPDLELTSYDFPDPMYFFEDTYSRIWITNLGYISFDTAYYGKSMTTSVFLQLTNQSIAAPFWADLIFQSSQSSITINWFSSISANQNSSGVYDPIIQQTINDACPTESCPSNYAALQAVRITWSNLTYQPPDSNQSISISFSAYLINTYDVASYSYPILRSYITFDYSNLLSNLGNLRPFVGFRGKTSMILVLNDPLFHKNAVFLSQSSSKSFNVGSRFLTQCEVSYLQATTITTMNVSENLNDVLNNPRFPCPCTLGQAQADRSFAPLMSETSYELNQNLVCYGPIITSWIHFGSSSKLLRSQTCCYNQTNGVLITSGFSAGSVLSTPFILFQPYPLQRRIVFHDQCCLPTYPSTTPDWNLCRLYYEVHPPSSCTGYQAPFLITGVGDPHVDTIDGGRYTCHIQGLYVFTQTNTQASTIAQYNLNNANTYDSSLIYPDDLFYIYVRSASLAPALPFIARIQGSASVYTGYTIGAGSYVFVITGSLGRFGFTATSNSNTVSLTVNLTNNLNFDYVNTNDYNAQYIYRLKQSSALVSTMTVPRLTLSIWSGVSIQCQIVGENLECVLSLPPKFQTHVEGLTGNFNGVYSDDLINRLTNQVVPISSAVNPTNLNNDQDVLNACRSWKVPTDTTPDISNPILPTTLINWYNSNSATLTRLNPKLSPTYVNQICSTSIECQHDYIIRINPITSAATASSINTLLQSRVILAEVPPTINVSSTITIVLPFNNTNRNYSVPISISGAYNNVLVTISNNGVIQTSTFNGFSITIPVPSDTSSYVQVFITATYGANSTLITYLNIITCLCVNSSYCNYQETTGVADHYTVASCTCPAVYDGVYCQSAYDGCTSPGACSILWNNGTTCIQLTPAEQSQQGRSYYCNGTCQAGFSTNNSYECDDINECNTNSSRCGPGTCVNLIGTYTCSCFPGYKFNNMTCVDLNECEEPNIDGTYTFRCNDTDQCINTIGSYNCTCSPVFMSNGICQYNASLCGNDTDTCRGPNNTLLCLHGTISINNTCVPWCNFTCPGFCDRVNGYFECNCGKYPGYESLDNGQECLPCDDASYGYNCTQSCECVYGTCNINAIAENGSCMCDYGYESTFCDKRVDMCATPNQCYNATEDCVTSPTNASVICNCKVGYGRLSNNTNCTDINECALDQDDCDPTNSYCNNTIGSYICICLSGYQQIDGECIDINECNDPTICASYNNTYCANLPGTYECRCDTDYALDGDYTEQYEDARASNTPCLPINYSSFCENQCLLPAVCSAATGECECTSSSYTLVDYALDDTLQTCDCPGNPAVYFNGTECVNVSGIVWFILDLSYNSTNSTSMSRVALINGPGSVPTETKISNILSSLNKTCNESCINIYDTQDVVPPNLQLLTALDVDLNVTERLRLINALYSSSITYNGSYSLAMVQMIMDPANGILYTFTGPQHLCIECSILGSGNCTADYSNCNCSPGYEGYFCRGGTAIVTTPATATTANPLQGSSAVTNWTTIVAVVSAIGGVLLLVSLAMVIYFLVTKCRRLSVEKNPRMARQQFSIPRAHIPTMGAGSRGLKPFDDFSLDDTIDDQFVDASDSFTPSSTMTYTSAYNPNARRPKADFGIFDDLERRMPLPKGHIPRAQMSNMLETLNSLPPDEPDGTISSFTDSQDIDEIELVTDILDDMTRKDNDEDEFVEALNPNLAIPRLAAAPQLSSTGWLSFFRNS